MAALARQHSRNLIFPGATLTAEPDGCSWPTLSQQLNEAFEWHAPHTAS